MTLCERGRWMDGRMARRGSEVSVTAMDSAAGEPVPRAGDAPPAGAAVVPAVKPLLRGWLHLICFEASLVLGTLALVHAHGTVRITAMAVFAASVSAMLGTSALYHRGNWAAGLALPGVWLHSGPAAGALMLAGGLLYTAGALSYHRRWPNPSPAIFGYHEVFHVFVCAAAACQYTAIALFIA
jgi:predicted membrane channel-forming protein YqfA (hemolysin III family)